ncbi:PilC/PilY family type IV pilus protein [Motiliproteus sp. SC1-56]|uniref:PilC/PilY family type IV pilus protein n=1 Tax=Motiliproteus sp. SC1-56 TaxID=2799565 RepID=UPI001A8F117C|nr:PilC/PilY family type IV pilus protein [Motiliproteus sp. SC1-56]
MNGIYKHARVLLGSFLSTWMVCTPAWADDTEIYFGGSSTVTVQPNVLFVLDTSSSMMLTDGGDTTRLDRMKRALNNILNAAQDINVGLMRFSDPGGPVLYPIRDINGTLSGTPSAGQVLTGSVNRTIEVSEDDAEQSALGIMRLNSTALEMTEVPPTAAGSVDVQVSFYKDDAEENVASGAVNRTSSDLELAHEDGRHEQIIGLRFQNVNIPQGATITSANIEFEIDSKRTGDVSFRIYGEDVDSASFFLDSQNGNISGRSKTAASALWANVDDPGPNQSLFTSDISAVVQEVVDRTGWAANNHMAFIIEHESGSGYREVETVDGESDAAAILHVTYEASETSGPQLTALRFNEINVPQGATITSAELTFTANGDTSGPTDLIFLAEYAGHSEPFTGTEFDISSRTATDSVGVGMVENTVPSWTEGTEYTFSSGDAGSIASLVQTVVNHSDWCGGNSISFFVQGTGLRTAKAYEANPSLAPRLDLTYTFDESAPGCYTREYAKIITASSDDAEQYSSGSVHLDSTDLELVVDDANSSGNQTVGLRFNNLQLNQGSTLNHAYLEFAVDEVDPAASTSLVIHAEDTDNSTTFTTAAGDISTRPKTSASVTWEINDQWPSEHDIKRSPNIAPLLNEVLQRAGWAGGNSISFIISGNGNRIVESYDGSTLAPRLVYYAKDSDVTASTNTVRDDLKQMVNGIQYKPGTPLTDALYEAARYFRGEGVDYGLKRGGDSTTRREYTRISHIDSHTGTIETLDRSGSCTGDNLDSSACADEHWDGTPTYITPVTESCQPNYIVLLSDGLPNSNSSADKIQNMTGLSSCAESGAKACTRELVDYLNNADQLTSLANNQTVQTYTIGFNFSDPWLANLAYEGDGAFYEAESAADLTSVFDSIVRSIKAVNTTFVEPSVTINQFNRFAHRDDVYFSLFKPQETAKWYGNLKRYQLKGSPATLYDNRNPQQPAIDPLTGFFSQDSKSFWSADEDGNQVEKGGAASRLPLVRNVFTNASGAALSVSENRVHESNPLITKELLDIVGKTDAYRHDLLQWARGLDENDALRYELGDPLHSRPELVTYDGNSTVLESTIFFGTNEGYLHAVDINTGIEQFAFIPKELLANLNTYFVNASVDPRPYGLDGGITIWQKDANMDGDLKDADDFARLYIGMRRGGRNYYALDVTDVDNPQVLWQINGGSGDFAHLGQTWSKPVKSKVMFNGVVYDVLIFGGGYDPNQDNASQRTVDSMGNAIYMVDATNGNLLWSAGGDLGHDLTVSGMDYSIPSTVQVLDMNQDGRADQLYVGDMGGQIWRFDIDNTATQLQHFANATRIADLAGTDAANNRRFYYAPDLALAVEGKDRYLSLAIGSGYRAHPLNMAIEDRFYMIKLFDTYDEPSSWTTLTEADLYDATDNHIMQGDANQQNEAEVALSNSHTNRKQGWYLRMENTGEKVLSSSTTIQNQIVFTTYEPSTPETGSCNPARGTSRAYLVSLFDATPMRDINNDASTTKDDRVIQLQIGSIPATPTVIDTLESKPTVWVGPERLDQVDTNVESVRTYWIEVNQ